LNQLEDSVFLYFKEGHKAFAQFSHGRLLGAIKKFIHWVNRVAVRVCGCANLGLRYCLCPRDLLSSKEPKYIHSCAKTYLAVRTLNFELGGLEDFCVCFALLVGANLLFWRRRQPPFEFYSQKVAHSLQDKGFSCCCCPLIVVVCVVAGRTFSLLSSGLDWDSRIN